MASVTARIKVIKQPRGGYINASTMEITSFDDNEELNETQNFPASIVGTAVDYLTRFMMGSKIKDAFSISIKGAELAAERYDPNSLRLMDDFLSQIKGLDKNSIINACRATTFDVWYRKPSAAFYSRNSWLKKPDANTIENIQILTNRSLAFWKKFGPVKVDGFSFGEKGYTKTVDSGDGDFLTADTLWEFKVTQSPPDKNQTLQILMYYVMGKHSELPEFSNINKIGIFNPKLNKAYVLKTDLIPAETIKIVEREIICYK